MDSSRIANVERLLAETIAERGIEFKAVNPSSLSKEEFDALLREFAPEGFDDIIMLVPVVPVLAHAANYLGEDGLMNIFAGIPAGVEGMLSIDGHGESRLPVYRFERQPAPSTCATRSCWRRPGS